MRRYALPALALALVLTPAAGLAQQALQRPSEPARRAERQVPEQPADQTRQELAQILQQYPPTLPQVLRLDSSLMRNAEYLSLYPNLAAFLERHPEVVNNPNYYVSNRWGSPYVIEQPPNARRDVINSIEAVLVGIAFFTVAVFVLSLTAWGLKTFVEHRRFLRVSKIQTDTHSKLLDRLTSNEDLLAYIQSPAGRQFLEGTPILPPAAVRRPAISAPINRILWSVQAGVV